MELRTYLSFPREVVASIALIQRASEASEADSQSCSIEISDILLASERSERDTYRGKNEKIGDVYLLASERSERDSIRGG